MATFNGFNAATENLMEGVHDLGADQLVAALCASANAPEAFAPSAPMPSCLPSSPRASCCPAACLPASPHGRDARVPGPAAAGFHRSPGGVGNAQLLGAGLNAPALH